MSDTTKDNLQKDPPQPLYKCKDCSFTTKVADALQKHKKDEHPKQNKHDTSETLFLHKCITCNYKTNDYNDLIKHIDGLHRQPDIPKSSLRCK